MKKGKRKKKHQTILFDKFLKQHLLILLLANYCRTLELYMMMYYYYDGKIWKSWGQVNTKRKELLLTFYIGKVKKFIFKGCCLGSENHYFVK